MVLTRLMWPEKVDRLACRFLAVAHIRQDPVKPDEHWRPCFSCIHT